MVDKPTFRIVLACVLLREGKALLGKRSEDEDVLPGYWGLPGGNLTTIGNIEDIFGSELQREIKEEIGVEIKNARYLESHSHEKQVINVSFVAEISSGEPQALDETEEVRWFTLEEARKLKLTPKVLDRLTLAFAE